MQAAARAGVRRVVYTSSAASVGEANGTIGRECSVHRGTYLSVYDRSKHEGEQAAFAAAHRTGVEVVAICPSSVQGPGRTTGNGKLIVDYVNGKLPVFVDTYVSVVDIADTTEAHVLAAERGRAGARYILNGATITSAEALDLVAGISGVRHHVRIVPPAVAMSAAGALEAVYTLRGRVPSLCRARIRTFLHGHQYDGSLADPRARARLHAGRGDVPPHDRVGGVRRGSSRTEPGRAQPLEQVLERARRPQRLEHRARPTPRRYAVAVATSKTSSSSTGWCASVVNWPATGQQAPASSPSAVSRIPPGSS